VILVSIEVAKIDKSRFYEDRKRGRILDLVLIETPNSKYSDYLVKQSQTKEERERGERGEIIGNAKNVGKGNGKRGGGQPPRDQGDAGDDW